MSKKRSPTGINIRGGSGNARANSITVILYPKFTDYLDTLALAIRRATSVKVKRSEIIRGVLTGLADARGLDLGELHAPVDDKDASIEEQIAVFIRDTLAT